MPDRRPDTHRWWALAVLVTAQLMLMLDVTIVNIALPAAQADLGISDASRQWVLTAYALPFGGLLLLGGRIADRVGQRRTLCISLFGFAAASALGGLAWEPAPLFAARGLQGVFAAAMAPALLSSISLLFPDGSARDRAFGLFGAVSAAGGAAGLILGGILTEYASWRWCLLVNAPLALGTAIAASRLLTRGRSADKAPYDVPGAVLATAASFSLVFAVSHAANAGWSAPVTIASLTIAALLTAAFVVVEGRVTHPLLPLGLLLNRVRAGAFVSCLLSFGANMGATLIIVVYLQEARGWTALAAGVAFLPFMAGAALGSVLATQLLPRVPARGLMSTGFAFAAIGVALLASIAPDSDYATSVLPGLALDGFGVALLFVPATSLALHAIPERDSGVASGTLTATQQIGAAIGVAIMNTVAVSATSGYIADGGRPGADAVVHGFDVALLVATGLLVAGGLLAAALVRTEPNVQCTAVPNPHAL